MGSRRADPMCGFRRALTNINAISWLLRAPSARIALLRYRVDHPLMCRYFAGSVMCAFHCVCIGRPSYARVGCYGGACELTLASEYGPGPLCVAACSEDCPPPCRYCAAPGNASGISSICVRGCGGYIYLICASHRALSDTYAGVSCWAAPSCERMRHNASGAAFARGVAGSMCESHCALSDT